MMTEMKLQSALRWLRLREVRQTSASMWRQLLGCSLQQYQDLTITCIIHIKKAESSQPVNLRKSTAAG